MKEKTVAKVWAQALLETAHDRKAVEAVVDGVRVLAILVGEIPELSRFTASPKVEPDRKKAMLAKALAGSLDPLLLDFLGLVVDRGRGEILGEIVQAFLDQYDEASGILKARVFSAVPLADALAEKVRKQLETMYGKKIALDLHVDPETLGGLTLQVGDTRFDGSLDRALNEIRARLLGARIVSEVVYADQD